ncbi:unnamed protein product, partial [Discosporangium mesarthrocarpum]
LVGALAPHQEPLGIAFSSCGQSQIALIYSPLQSRMPGLVCWRHLAPGPINRGSWDRRCSRFHEYNALLGGFHSPPRGLHVMCTRGDSELDGGGMDRRSSRALEIEVVDAVTEAAAEVVVDRAAAAASLEDGEGSSQKKGGERTARRMVAVKSFLRALARRGAARQGRGQEGNGGGGASDSGGNSEGAARRSDSPGLGVHKIGGGGREGAGGEATGRPRAVTSGERAVGAAAALATSINHHGSVVNFGDGSVPGVEVNGYWFPSLEAAYASPS